MRHVAIVLFVIAILVRALVPGGYMVQASAEGGFEIVICTDGGTDTIRVDAQGTPIEPSNSADTGDTCPFALASLSILADAATLAQDFIRQPVSLDPILHADQRVRIAILAINAARAPPTLA